MYYYFCYYSTGSHGLHWSPTLGHHCPLRGFLPTFLCVVNCKIAFKRAKATFKFPFGINNVFVNFELISNHVLNSTALNYINSIE